MTHKSQIQPPSKTADTFSKVVDRPSLTSLSWPGLVPRDSPVPSK